MQHITMPSSTSLLLITGKVIQTLRGSAKKKKTKQIWFMAKPNQTGPRQREIKLLGNNNDNNNILISVKRV